MERDLITAKGGSGGGCQRLIAWVSRKEEEAGNQCFNLIAFFFLLIFIYYNNYILFNKH